jgi:hypothetical protein
MKVIFLCLLFLVPAAFAEDKGIFYILDEKFIDNISKLPESTNITPDKTIQKTDGYLAAWIDIAGWKNLTRNGEKYYVYGNLAESVIIRYDVGIYDGEKRPFLTIAQASLGSGIVFDSLDKTTSIEQHGNNTTVRLHAVLKYHMMCTDGYGSFICRRGTESHDFVDTEPSPEIYEPISESFKVNLTQYNTSLFENIWVQTSIPRGLSKIRFEYGDLNATHTIYTGHVEKTAKGVYFANISYIDTWETKGHIGRIVDTIVIDGNLSKMNPGDIKITGSSLYETKIADSTQFNITRREFKPEKELDNPVLMWFMTVMAVMVGGVYFFARRMTGQWSRNM